MIAWHQYQVNEAIPRRNTRLSSRLLLVCPRVATTKRVFCQGLKQNQALVSGEAARNPVYRNKKVRSPHTPGFAATSPSNLKAKFVSDNDFAELRRLFVLYALLFDIVDCILHGFYLLGVFIRDFEAFAFGAELLF